MTAKKRIDKKYWSSRFAGVHLINKWHKRNIIIFVQMHHTSAAVKQELTFLQNMKKSDLQLHMPVPDFPASVQDQEQLPGGGSAQFDILFLDKCENYFKYIFKPFKKSGV